MHEIETPCTCNVAIWRAPGHEPTVSGLAATSDRGSKSLLGAINQGILTIFLSVVGPTCLLTPMRPTSDSTESRGVYAVGQSRFQR